jgi:hypothetical protein
MIDMGVTEHDRVDSTRIKQEMTILLDRFGAFALEKPALQQYIFLIYFEKEHGAGRGAGGSEELNLHAGTMRAESKTASFWTATRADLNIRTNYRTSEKAFTSPLDCDFAPRRGLREERPFEKSAPLDARNRSTLLDDLKRRLSSF